MKYKLLKDIIGSEAWTIFEYKKVSYWNWVELVEWKSLWNILDLIKAIWIDNKEYFKVIQEESKSVFDLKEWDEFYLLFNNWWALKYNNISYYTDELSQWNIFLTRKEAEKDRDKRTSLVNIKRWRYKNNAEYEFKLGKKNWYISLYEDSLWVDYTDYKGLNDIYFSSKELAEKCLQECERDWKILFDITE